MYRFIATIFIAIVGLVGVSTPAWAWDDEKCLDWWTDHDGDIHEDCTWWTPPTTTTVDTTTTTIEEETTTTTEGSTTSTTAPAVTTTVEIESPTTVLGQDGDPHPGWEPATTVPQAPAEAPQAAPVAAEAELPRTGASTVLLVTTALVLIAAGLILGRKARRREV